MVGKGRFHRSQVKQIANFAWFGEPSIYTSVKKRKKEESYCQDSE